MRLMHPARAADVLRETLEVGRRADGSPLLADLTRPREATGPLPVAFVVHGAVPDAMQVDMRASEMYRDWGTVLAAGGVAGVMFHHTLGWPELRVGQAQAECDQVLAWLAEGGAALGLDLSRVTAIIVSGGGVLAPELLTGPRPLSVGAAAFFSPLTAALPDDKRPAEQARRMSLAEAAGELAARKPPLLIFRAGGDRPEMLDPLDSAVAALLAADADVTVDNFPGAPHCYEVLLDHPRSGAAVDRAVALARGL